MSHHDLVQRALRLLTHPIEMGEAKEALRPQQGGNHALKDSTVHPGDQITWTRADGTTQTGVVDDLHMDDAGTRWAFCTTTGAEWTAVNVKFVTGSGHE